MMRILYDHQIFSWQRYGGVSRYFSNLIHALPQFTKSKTFVPLVFSNNFYLCERNKDNSLIDFLPNLDFSGKYFVRKFFNQLKSKRSLNENKFDLFHPTDLDPYFLKYNKKPFVITIHDLIRFKYPDDFQKNDQILSDYKFLAKKANHIIAVSENTKADCVKLLEIPEEKIDVVYHGIYTSDSHSPVDLELPGSYILYVGTRKHRYKNFQNFVKGIAPILQDKVNISLLCVGGGVFSPEEKQMLQELGILAKSSVKQLSDKELEIAYKKALVFVFPSLDEGFGFPILEAFSNQCPVALAKASCFPEIAVDAAQFFDPVNPKDIEAVIKSIIDSPELRNELIMKGLRRVDFFSMEKNAQKTFEVYHKVLQKEQLLSNTILD